MTALDDLLTAVRASAEPAEVSPQFAPKADVGAWLASVAAARAAADARAVRHRVIVDAASERLFGTSIDALLPPSPELERFTLTVAVPGPVQLGDVVPALTGVAPVGPEWYAAETAVTVQVTAPVSPTAAVVRLHGGAYWMGGGGVSERIDRALLEQIAVTANAAVLDVDNRLAPEHPYPAAIVDALCVLDAARAGAAGFVPSAVALAGTSSGAGAVTLAACADALRPSAPLAALALIVPSVLLSDGPSSLRDDPAAWAARQDLLRSYLGDIDPADPWVSPAVLPELPGMPPTFAAIAEFDEVAAGGPQLAAAIPGAESRTYPMTHTTAPPAVEAQVVQDTARFLARHLLP
ncbi:MAG: alpha/beta hydrolase fold domain-containing protein [Microbacterium sp.]